MYLLCVFKDTLYLVAILCQVVYTIFRIYMLANLYARKDEMNDIVRLFDIVALTTDLPEYGLQRWQVGTVVEFLAHGNAFEVEFSDNNGQVYQSLGLRPDQIMVLYYTPTQIAADEFMPSALAA